MLVKLLNQEFPMGSTKFRGLNTPCWLAAPNSGSEKLPASRQHQIQGLKSFLLIGSTHFKA
jgi:hypothetical protein